MRAVDIIRKKRDGHALDRAEIDAFVSGATTHGWRDYQVAALLMAIVLRGMSAEETAWLTAAMVGSGQRLDWSFVPGPKVDKHSTGGVGDKTSLVLVPLAAACGVIVPKMSGRGLGHTGGTLDKLESIPGFRVGLSLDEFRSVVARVGCALVSQSAEIAPADKVLYALRDVTGTVESLPLIAASIMSKKLAEGIDGLVLDVKCGSGAFMKTEAEARRLAEAMVAIGKANGVRTQALLTTMGTPLGRAVGNAVEVIESLETLKGRGPRDLTELAVQLASRMVLLAGRAVTPEGARTQVMAAFASGRALEKLRDVIAAQGGDPRVVEDYARFPRAPQRELVRARRGGWVVSLNAELVGRAVMLLGAGRERKEETIDPSVGAILRVSCGEAVQEGEALLELQYGDGARLGAARELLAQAIEIGDAEPPERMLVLDSVG